MEQPVKSAMTVDVEDYFHVSAFESKVTFADWGKTYPIRVERNTQKILELFANHDAKATFFVLGWVAEQCPELIKQITSQGHELACHGFAHQRANHQSREVFREDVYRAKSYLEEITGVEVKGYRAPSFSIGPSNEWAYEVLRDLGFLYSSSTYPVKHDLYGTPDWPKFIYQRKEGVIEIPIPTNKTMGMNLPIGGGGFFRLYPYSLSKTLITNFLAQTGQPYCFYFHPWEIDPGQPRMAGVPLKSSFRHYLNLSLMEKRLSQLLSDFEWDTMFNVYQLNGFENDRTTANQNNN
ncbi:DUF3473 domain-containing protein [Vibrio hannami]|uniref:XrtA system polysaccharide deacetylase n=1 Tax=Vibrio hannami TaxID=2717094 RepID=UPI0024102A14|nr:XrtA system polysaccharide deacetylase [Vibrio hannami]MDG3088270.1 DUF3473 domain-containing protein [Vibrio hannami]